MPKLPVVSGERIVGALKGAAFVELRQRGSHVSLEKKVAEKIFRTVVPMHSTLAKGTLSDILKQAGLSFDEFLSLPQESCVSPRFPPRNPGEQKGVITRRG